MTLEEIEKSLAPPYWVYPKDDKNPPMKSFNDFCREIIPPGASIIHPDGVVGIRMDGNFWAIAALPWPAIHFTIEQIVRHFWPEYADAAEYLDDVYKEATS